MLKKKSYKLRSRNLNPNEEIQQDSSFFFHQIHKLSQEKEKLTKTRKNIFDFSYSANHHTPLYVYIHRIKGE